MSGANPLKVAILRLYYRIINWWAWRNHFASGLRIRDLEIPSSAGTIPARIYDASDSPKALLLYFHGGGWVIGDLKTHDPFCRKLAEDTQCRVLAVDYRRAPEHPFPAAIADSLAVTDWVFSNAAACNPDALPVMVAGDSAGGNLSAIVAKERPSRLRGQILIYPVTRHYDPFTDSYVENAKGYGLTTKLMIWFWDSYLFDSPLLNEGQVVHPLATPAFRGPTPDLPPALVITAGLDPLRDEGIAYAESLKDAGVPCQHLHYVDAMHGFLCSDGPTGQHEAAMGEISDWIKS